MAFETLPEDTQVTPEAMFMTQGRNSSQNIAVICAAAKYLQEGDPDWFERYFAWMESNLSRTGHFMGGEINSPIYATMVSSPILIVYSESKVNEHLLLEQRAQRWLKTFWAEQSLAAVKRLGSITSYTGHVHGETIDLIIEGAPPNNCPVVTPIPGTRSLPESQGYMPNDKLLSLALGYRLPMNGRCNLREGDWEPVDALRQYFNIGSAKLDPSIFGMTSQERRSLQKIVDRGSKKTILANLATAFAMIGDHTPFEPMTFARYRNGVVSYFGTWKDGAKNRFGSRGHKQILYASKFNATFRHLEVLSPSIPAVAGGDDSGWSGKFESEVCAFADKVKDCMSFGDLKDLIYVVEWLPGSGLELIYPSG